MLSATLEEFRLKHGFGRAMAAPQIGINLRIIAFNLNAHRFSMINPRITEASQEKFTMWDDCMSFPDLLVRVERNTSVSVEYLDEQGTTRTLENLPKAESELIQHEIDHLDGILAIDRAMDKDSIIYRTVFKTDPGYFCSLVDYVIC
jgi:peptide deformylase